MVGCWISDSEIGCKVQSGLGKYHANWKNCQNWPKMTWNRLKWPKKTKNNVKWPLKWPLKWPKFDSSQNELLHQNELNPTFSAKPPCMHLITVSQTLKSTLNLRITITLNLKIMGTLILQTTHHRIRPRSVREPELTGHRNVSVQMVRVNSDEFPSSILAERVYHDGVFGFLVRDIYDVSVVHVHRLFGFIGILINLGSMKILISGTARWSVRVVRRIQIFVWSLLDVLLCPLLVNSLVIRLCTVVLRKWQK